MEKSPNMVKSINEWILETEWIFSRINSEKSTPWLFTVNLLKMKYRKNVESSWLETIYCWNNDWQCIFHLIPQRPDYVAQYFSSAEKKIIILEFYTQWKYSHEWKRNQGILAQKKIKRICNQQTYLKEWLENILQIERK